MVKPVPARVTLLMVTGAAPEELRRIDCVDSVFSTTLPKDTLVALTLNIGWDAFNCREKLFETLPAVAVSVAVCAELTAETVAVKLAVVAPAGIVAVAGSVTDALLLDRLTLSPPVGAAPLSVTVQESVPAPVNEPLVQERLLRTTFGLNCSAKVLETLPAVAVSVAVCAELTAETVAVKVALEAPAGTKTVAGTETGVSLLERPTLNPPSGATPLNATVHVSVPDPVIEALLQENEVSVGVAAAPLPLRFTTVELPDDELLSTVIWPVAAPRVRGLKSTMSLAV